ncbi:sucrase ferredoxin [Leifsonia sp. ZF2019]|uniref:sucrase ferredoxin n=1 Tax=Leifsonia sp. ZF2019 TaxID=2781978 RepID=UPI001CC12CAA|nr:sucrase ferredoxin [Leifsonia sp. ZF2019]UAJ78139.1 sucrase ferredoxin [Leifsonia sp. ZF2019]
MTTAAGWLPCSDRARERGDPLAGTAGLGERWLLVEIESGWGRHAFFDSALDPAVGAALVARAEAAGIRPLAIRRTGLRAEDRRGQRSWRWALVDARPGRAAIRWGRADTERELLALPLDGSAGVPSDRPVYAVCAHARHDQCCAVRGRPVVQALAAAHPDETWECSHLGGDRFAATMIVFPHGLLYGRVPAAEAGQVVARYAEGRVDPRYLRGRTALSTVAQAAEAFARDHSGDDAIEAFRVLEEHAHPHGWTVRLAHAGGAVEVEVGERLSEPLLSTCAATVAHRVREFVPVSVRRA